ncbi:penicillin-binding protein [Helicobacter sp. 16-1353]|uniref:transglycosylase domain-containing protein n=1 Tax=Helicobacter sp. 16-1353 TaxID=2004996 RepID=UPI000DCB4F62|nr:PBP1A family penicillin-binding protein [Helicobacter sp. 16-1353]RAX54632.1 penicillin-binding protein [Helicobacter sp. 16-1353]
MQFIKKLNKKVILAILLLVVFFIIGFIAIVVYDTQSKVSTIINYKPGIALKILDRKDRLVANVFENEFRYYTTFEQIPPKIIETLLAVEDTMFFEHNGVNFDAISRAMLKNIKSGGYIEGGSTITQQLVKNVALSREKTIDRKLKEAVLAIQVENILSKEEILEKYLNYIYFGHGYYGVKTAAHGYFNKELPNLSLKEIAMLMALPRAPSYYDPVKNFEFSLSRANSILERMFSLGWINKDEYETAINEKPKVYDQTLTQNLAPYVVDEVLRQLGHIKDLKTGGYIVRLNIDLDYQKVAQDALIYGYENIQKRLDSLNKKDKNKEEIQEEADDLLNGAIVVTQSRTGNVLALVGGVDYAKSNFNRATQAQRQFGSTVKPFIYQIAFDMGYSSASTISDVARSFKEIENIKSDMEGDEEIEEERIWKPKNYTQNFSGIVTLKDALRRSLNLATVNLVDLIGFQNIYNKMLEYGFKNIQKDMSIILGSFTLSPMDAIRQYSLFANYGTINEPKLIRSIVNDNNEEIFAISNEMESVEENNINEILENIEKNPLEFTTPSQAYITIDILRSVITHGTGRRAHVNGIELAGKTGTSNDNVDAWFSGFSPTLQVVVWYGRDDNTPIGEHQTGGVVAAPAFANFFRNILKVEPGLKRVFDIPEGVWKQNINGEDYYYTETSKIPKQRGIDKIDDNLLF